MKTCCALTGRFTVFQQVATLGNRQRPLCRFSSPELEGRCVLKPTSKRAGADLLHGGVALDTRGCVVRSVAFMPRVFRPSARAFRFDVGDPFRGSHGRAADTAPAGWMSRRDCRPLPTQQHSTSVAARFTRTIDSRSRHFSLSAGVCPLVRKGVVVCIRRRPCSSFSNASRRGGRVPFVGTTFGSVIISGLPETRDRHDLWRILLVGAPHAPSRR